MTLSKRVALWIRENMPTREGMESNRWLRPFAHRILQPELWRFTRRSVPRGVALGMITGILFPVAQIVFSAMLALPFRANIPAAVMTTFITNPFTTPAVWALAYWIGRHVLRLDGDTPGRPIGTALANDGGWVQWFFAEAGPAIAVGLVVISISGAVLGYVVTAIGWRFWIARKWRARRMVRV